MTTLFMSAAYLIAAGATAQPPATPAPAPAADKAPHTFKQPIPSAAYDLEMTLVPADEARHLPAFYLSTTEVTWEAYDVFVYGLDGTDNDDKPASGKPEDAVSRPSKPYIPPDRGFGHEGYAAICVSSKAVEEYCKWLSAKTGRHFRLPTEDEWEHAAQGGTSSKFPWGDDGAKASEYAWYGDNSENTTHPVNTRKPNGFGLADMLGNAREWVQGRDGQPVLKGGGYRDKLEDCAVTRRWPFDKAWQVTDPQIPKSKWWLSDGSFISFRIACDAETGLKAPAGDPLDPMKRAPGSSPTSKPAQQPAQQTGQQPQETHK
ncbi:MAG: SUMF1/EgtB/PvdO family nonheme iron enzyme [Phycisphaerales bacterium]